MSGSQTMKISCRPMRRSTRGNSGGPLINMRGEVIGMNSAIETDVGDFGVGFAIPVNMIKSMLPTLIKGKQITRGMLGISIQDVTKELAETFDLSGDKGALISQVNKDSPEQGGPEGGRRYRALQWPGGK